MNKKSPFLADNLNQKIGSRVAGVSMQEYDKLTAEKTKLTIAKHAITRSLESVFGAQYANAMSVQEQSEKEMRRLLKLVWEKEGEIGDLSYSIDEEKYKLALINAQRRRLVFDAHVGSQVPPVEEYKGLERAQTETIKRITALQQRHVALQRDLNKLDAGIMQLKHKSTSAFDVLGQTPATFQAKIIAIETRLRKIEGRQKQLLMQIGSQKSKLLLRSTGAQV